MQRLTDAKIGKIDRPGSYPADTTLFLKVAPTGAKSWVQRIVINGVRRDIGLGGWPVVMLDDAKLAALQNRRLVRAGGDPVAEKRKKKMPTFREAVDKALTANRSGWKGTRAVTAWNACMETSVLPKIGDMKVDQIGRDQVLSILVPIWNEKTETARKCRMRLKAVFAWCQSHGFIHDNPADAGIDGALPKSAGVKEHFQALHYGRIGDALLKIRMAGGGLAARHCLEFLILTATRSGEARGATWDEIDLEARTWTIKAERMKSGREHRVPLGAAALNVLERAALLRDKRGMVFPAPRASVMAANCLLRILELIELKGTTVHGFRSSFRDWCADTGKAREIAEAALAHIVGGVEGAYFRSDLFDRRRLLMEQWASYILMTSAKVVELNRNQTA